MSTVDQRRVRRIGRQRRYRTAMRQLDEMLGWTYSLAGIPDVREETAAIVAPLNALYRPPRRPLYLTRRQSP